MFDCQLNLCIVKLIFNLQLFSTIIFLSKLAEARPFILGRKKRVNQNNNQGQKTMAWHPPTTSKNRIAQHKKHMCRQQKAQMHNGATNRIRTSTLHMLFAKCLLLFLRQPPTPTRWFVQRFCSSTPSKCSIKYR